MPSFSCMHCSQPIEADDALAGTTANCPACGGTLTIPALPAAERRPAESKPDVAPWLRAAPPATTSSESQSPAEPARESARNVAAGERPSHEIHSPVVRPKQPAGVWTWWPLTLIGTLVALAVTFTLTWVRPPTMAEAFGIQRRDTAACLFETLGALIVVAGTALVLGLVTAACVNAKAVSFGRIFSRVYAIAVLVLSSLHIKGAMHDPGKEAGWSTREIQRERKEALEKPFLPKLEDSRINLQNSAPQLDNALSRPLLPLDRRKLFRAIIDAHAAEVEQLNKDYISELQQAGVGQLWDAERVLGDERLAESRRILARLRASAQKYRARSAELMKRAPDLLMCLKTPDDVSPEVMARLRKSLERADTWFDGAWDMESEIRDIDAALLDHLEAARSRWKVKGGQFDFELKADLDRHKELCERRRDNAKYRREFHASAFLELKSNLMELVESGKAPIAAEMQEPIELPDL